MAKGKSSKYLKSKVKKRISEKSQGNGARDSKLIKAKSVAKAESKARGAEKIESATKPRVATLTAKEKPEISQKLIDTIKNRRGQNGGNSKKRGAQLFARPGMRRGRRPKALEGYTPTHQEEDAYVLESDAEALEYDTGIRVKEQSEDGVFGAERMDDFDEELNFDW